MDILIGVTVGAVIGAFGFYALYRFVSRFTTGHGSGGILWALAFFLLPPAALVLLAFLFPAGLVPAGIAMTGTLLVSALAFFIRRRNPESKANERDENRKT